MQHDLVRSLGDLDLRSTLPIDLSRSCDIPLVNSDDNTAMGNFIGYPMLFSDSLYVPIIVPEIIVLCT